MCIFRAQSIDLLTIGMKMQAVVQPIHIAPVGVGVALGPLPPTGLAAQFTVSVFSALG